MTDMFQILSAYHDPQYNITRHTPGHTDKINLNFCYAEQHKHVVFSVCFICSVCFPSVKKIEGHRTSRNDGARLHLMAPMDFWQNSIPFFCVTAFCMTKIGEFRRQPKQGEKLAQAPAWEICSAGQCGLNRWCFQGDPVSCFFLGGKGVIVKTFLLRGLQKIVFQNIL